MNIQIYTKPNCTYCVQAKDLMSKCGLRYEEFTIGIHITVEELIEHLKRNVKTVPQIVIDKEVVGGFNHLKEYLLDKGYINFKGEIIGNKERQTVSNNA
jgi:glutaredoxin|tara:strand:+ start:756 stop:1052 length:297 start_codon:yes stop_codon:yes gene_type:complete